VIRQCGCQAPQAWWVALHGDQVAGYMVLHGENLDHLYILPTLQGCGFGSRLLAHAKTLSPDRVKLYAFQRNTKARAFYEAHGFCAVKLRDGSNNEEGEPDVEYEWRGAIS
jgi:ribosomal protein S18 acetylase RimI-like enzyme